MPQLFQFSAPELRADLRIAVARLTSEAYSEERGAKLPEVLGLHMNDTASLR